MRYCLRKKRHCVINIRFIPETLSIFQEKHLRTFYRRKLPHWHPESVSIFLTWRLFGSLPRQADRDAQQKDRGRAFVEIDRLLDRAVHGPQWLRDPRLAALVTDALEHGDRVLRRYDLIAYVVMSNHVHALLSPIAGVPLITRTIKGTTARGANQILKRTGQPFWQHESFDHWVRNDFERRRIIGYIEANPVTAGLVKREQDWPWSSAARWRNRHQEDPDPASRRRSDPPSSQRPAAVATGNPAGQSPRSGDD